MCSSDLFVNTLAFGITEIQLSGEVRNPNTEIIPVELTNGVIRIGGPRLLGDFDESGKVALVDSQISLTITGRILKIVNTIKFST